MADFISWMNANPDLVNTSNRQAKVLRNYSVNVYADVCDPSVLTEKFQAVQSPDADDALTGRPVRTVTFTNLTKDEWRALKPKIRRALGTECIKNYGKN